MQPAASLPPRDQKETERYDKSRELEKVEFII
jgi:hypothetical protein